MIILSPERPDAETTQFWSQKVYPLAVFQPEKGYSGRAESSARVHFKK
jgi:hypothetical protein